MARRAAKDLPTELKAMARHGMDIIMLQECGVHESGSHAFTVLINQYVNDEEFKKYGPWTVHCQRAYCALVSQRKIARSKAQVRFVWPTVTPEDTQWKKKWRQPKLQLPTGARSPAWGGRNTSGMRRRGWHPCWRHYQGGGHTRSWRSRWSRPAADAIAWR